MTERRSGDIAAHWRMVFKESSQKDQREQMARSLGEDLGDFTLGTMTAKNASELTEDLIQNLDVRVPAYAHQTGSLLLLWPRVFGSDSMGLDPKIRLYPIDLEGDADHT